MNAKQAQAPCHKHTSASVKSIKYKHTDSSTFSRHTHKHTEPPTHYCKHCATPNTREPPSCPAPHPSYPLPNSIRAQSQCPAREAPHSADAGDRDFNYHSPLPPHPVVVNFAAIQIKSVFKKI